MLSLMRASKVLKSLLVTIIYYLYSAYKVVIRSSCSRIRVYNCTRVQFCVKIFFANACHNDLMHFVSQLNTDLYVWFVRLQQCFSKLENGRSLFISIQIAAQWFSKLENGVG